MSAFRVNRLLPVVLVIVSSIGILSTAFGADNSLTRAEVSAIKAKLVAVEKALGGEPSGYALDREDFSLPTEASPSRGGKYWPMGSSVSLTYVDKGMQDAEANAEEIAANFQQRYMAALASGNEAAANAVMSEMMQAQAAAGAEPKPELSANIQFNANSYAGIDPDGVLFEGPGYIALREQQVSEDTGQVVIYFDPVALRETETLSKVELKTPDDGVSNRTGVFNVTIWLNGMMADAEAVAKGIDTADVLAVIDAQ